jgi:hypothetical protein
MAQLEHGTSSIIAVHIHQRKGFPYSNIKIQQYKLQNTCKIIP